MTLTHRIICQVGMTYYSFCDVANETSLWCSVIVNGGSVAELNLIGSKVLFSFMDVNITIGSWGIGKSWRLEHRNS